MTECPYCKHSITADQDFVVCPRCMTPHHPECWRENGQHCSTLGCSGSGQLPTLRLGKSSSGTQGIPTVSWQTITVPTSAVAKRTTNTWRFVRIGAVSILFLLCMLCTVLALLSLAGPQIGEVYPVAPTPSATVRSPATSAPTMTPLRTGEEQIIGGTPMVYVQAGDFIMGGKGESDEQPQHSIYLDSFWIDKYEVTNALYKRCVDAGVCWTPSRASSKTRNEYYNNPTHDNYPVIYVSWDDANRYCNWAGKRLPTEAEWEKAARGTDGRAYPWGNMPNSSLANEIDGTRGDTKAVGSYPAGASPYGAMDMAGNVWEWIADWYDASYYAYSPRENPKGPQMGRYKVMRGGTSRTSIIMVPLNTPVRDESGSLVIRGPLGTPTVMLDVYVAARRYESPDTRDGFDYGFRCAK